MLCEYNTLLDFLSCLRDISIEESLHQLQFQQIFYRSLEMMLISPNLKFYLIKDYDVQYYKSKFINFK